MPLPCLVIVVVLIVIVIVIVIIIIIVVIVIVVVVVVVVVVGGRPSRYLPFRVVISNRFTRGQPYFLLQRQDMRKSKKTKQPKRDWNRSCSQPGEIFKKPTEPYGNYSLDVTCVFLMCRPHSFCRNCLFVVFFLVCVGYEHCSFQPRLDFLVFLDFRSHCLRDVWPAVTRLTVLDGTCRGQEGNREGA